MEKRSFIWGSFLFVFIVVIRCEFVTESSITTECIFDRYAAEVTNEAGALKKELIIIKKKRAELKRLKKMQTIPTAKTDVISLNIGGEILVTTRETLTRGSNSLFVTLFNGRWENRLGTDAELNFFFDLNSSLFRHFLEQMRSFDDKTRSVHFHLSNKSPRIVRSFNKILSKLGLSKIQTTSNDLIIFNVGGQIQTTRQKTLLQSQMPMLISPSNSKHDQIFIDASPNLFRELINRLRKQTLMKMIDFHQLWTKYGKDFYEMIKSFGFDIATTRIRIPQIRQNSKWLSSGIAIAGGRSSGDATNQLSFPYDMVIDDEENLIIADSLNHRLLSWKIGAKSGQVIAGGCGPGNRTDQLNIPTSILIDDRSKNFIVSEWGNERIMRWSRHSNRLRGQIYISNIICSGLAMDDENNLYVSDWSKHEVRRYRPNDRIGSIVAGGNGFGVCLNQLGYPWNIFVDKDQSVYVSDWENNRVMKWIRNSKEGLIVAGGQGKGNSLKQLNGPRGLFVDSMGTIYVVDEGNHRLMRWYKGAKEGSVVVGGNGNGNQCHQLSGPMSITVDQQNNLYIADYGNHRIQQFLIQSMNP